MPLLKRSPRPQLRSGAAKFFFKRAASSLVPDVTHGKSPGGIPHKAHRLSQTQHLIHFPQCTHTHADTHTHTLRWFQGQTPLSLLKHKWGDGRWRGSLAGPLCKGKIRKSSLSSKGSETKQGEKMTSPATNPAHLG